MQTKNFNVYNEKNKAVEEAYALLSANVNFSNNKNGIKTVALTSCSPKVGKTAIAINLAISMAKSGRKTLLVDTDIRKPSNVKRLGDTKVEGLSDIIIEKSSIDEALCNTNIPNLAYISCGHNLNSPIELLSSKNFEEFIKTIKEKYDYIIFDTPTLSSVIDGALVASKTDATILIGEMGVTKLTALQQSKEQLNKANANLLGVVLNRVKKRDYQKYVQAYNYFFDIKRFEKRKRYKKSEQIIEK